MARDKSSWPCSMLVFESDEVKESSSAWLGRQPAVLTGVLYCTVLYCTVLYCTVLTAVLTGNLGRYTGQAVTLTTITDAEGEISTARHTQLSLAGRRK